MLDPLYSQNKILSQSVPYRYEINSNEVVYRTSNVNGKITKAIMVYPDTLCLFRNPNIGHPSFIPYFSHPKFNDFPVVGISWEQANAYCDWLSKQIDLPCRLPTLEEYLYASVPEEIKNYTTIKNGSYKPIKSRQFFSYPWIASESSSEIIDKNGNYLANFGVIKDEYGIVLKYNNSDGFANIAKTGSYPASSNGIYDLAGNVAEWVNCNLQKENLLKSFAQKIQDIKIVNSNRLINGKIFEGIEVTQNNFDSIAFAFFNLYQAPYYREEWIRMGKPRVLPHTLDLMNDQNNVIDMVLTNTHNILSDYDMLSKMKNPMAVMGGSWNDGVALIQFGRIQAYPAEETKSTIGFRVAMDRINQWGNFNTNNINIQQSLKQ
jgi:hypothetical protein